MTISQHRTLLFIAGVPAAGKSFFGQWLEKEKSFLHIDIEKEGRIKELGLTTEWDYFIKMSTPSPFITKLKELNMAIALNWGFPIAFLNHVRILKEAGFNIWWFKADYSIARKVFQERDTKDVRLFDKQVSDIKSNMQEIKKIFNLNNMIETLYGDGSRLTPEDIYKAILQ